jgi:glycine oxidase
VYDVAIIGGGVIGLAIAWRASAHGMAVAVIDPAPGSGASHVAAGMLAPVAEAHFGEQRLLDLTLESWRRYPEFIAELESSSGSATGYLRCGALLVARDADDTAQLDREHRFRESLGLREERLTARECRRLEPGLAPSVRGGVLVEDDHQVDPRLLVSALRDAAARLGVTFVREAAAAVRVARGRVSGVQLRDAVVDARTTVLAAGCWSAHVAGLPPEAVPPVRPVKGQTIRLRATTAAAPVTRIVRGCDVYVVPRADGSVVIGSTVEERGFDTTVTAGAMFEMLRDARELVPDVSEMEVTEAIAGLRPGSPDNAPLIGAGMLDGLLVATGHYRNGVLLAPVTADAIIALLTDAQAPAVATHFSPARFASGEAVVA